MLLLSLFQFLTRLLTFKHLKHFSTYLVGRNGTMWKKFFSAPQNAKNLISWNKKTKCETTFYWQLGLRVWRIIPFITWWSHKRQTFTLISIKIIRIWKIFKSNRLFKHKEVVSNLRVCNNDLWKIWTSHTFHFSTRILNSIHTKVFNIISHNICRDVQHYNFSSR